MNHKLLFLIEWTFVPCQLLLLLYFCESQSKWPWNDRIRFWFNFGKKLKKLNLNSVMWLTKSVWKSWFFLKLWKIFELVPNHYSNPKQILNMRAETFFLEFWNQRPWSARKFAEKLNSRQKVGFRSKVRTFSIYSPASCIRQMYPG